MLHFANLRDGVPKPVRNSLHALLEQCSYNLLCCPSRAAPGSTRARECPRAIAFLHRRGSAAVVLVVAQLLAAQLASARGRVLLVAVFLNCAWRPEAPVAYGALEVGVGLLLAHVGFCLCLDYCWAGAAAGTCWLQVVSSLGCQARCRACTADRSTARGSVDAEVSELY